MLELRSEPNREKDRSLPREPTRLLDDLGPRATVESTELPSPRRRDHSHLGVSEPGLQLTPTEKLIELNDSYTSRLHLYGELVHDPTISVEESHG
jgi:hypothetical protein